MPMLLAFSYYMPAFECPPLVWESLKSNPRTTNLNLDGVSTSSESCFKEAVQLSLAISNTIKESVGTGSTLRRLAHEAYNLVIYAQLSTHGREFPQGLVTVLWDLLETLRSIHSFVCKYIARNRLVRFVSHQSDLRQIQGYRDMLRQCLDVFVLHSNINLVGCMVKGAAEGVPPAITKVFTNPEQTVTK